MARPKSRYPKELRKKKNKLDKRLKAPFQEMSDHDIVYHYMRDTSFLKTFMNYTGKDYSSSKNAIREALSYVDRKEFAKFVKICQEAFKAKGQDRRGFDHNIVALLQDVRRETYILPPEEVYPETVCQQWIFPYTIIYNYTNTFLYDVACDFFINDLDLKELMDKYELDPSALKETLKKIKAEGLIPLPI